MPSLSTAMPRTSPKAALANEVFSAPEVLPVPAKASTMYSVWQGGPGAARPAGLTHCTGEGLGEGGRGEGTGEGLETGSSGKKVGDGLGKGDRAGDGLGEDGRGLGEGLGSGG